MDLPLDFVIKWINTLEYILYNELGFSYFDNCISIFGFLCVLFYAFKTILGEDIHRFHQLPKGIHGPKKAALKA